MADVDPESRVVFPDLTLEERVRALGGTTIYYKAKNRASGQNGAAEPKPDAHAKPPDPDEQPLRVLSLPALAGLQVPERRWIIEDWIPVPYVTINYADGGVGKTLLALQLQAAAALGRPWLGLHVEPCRSLGLYTEDDATELHIRMDAIRQHYGVEWSDLGDMFPIDATGQDNILFRRENDGRMVMTKRFFQIREQAMDTKCRLVELDTAATTFGGSEIDRTQVTQYVGHCLTSLARDIDGAVFLNAHPSLAGMASGDPRSGSTAWSNSARSRLGFTRPSDDEGKVILDSPQRILTRRKANMAPTGVAITMEWRNGVFVPSNELNAFGSGARKDEAEAAFLAALRAERAKNMHVSSRKHAGNYAPRTLHKTPAGAEFSVKELTEAMDNLLKRGRLRTAAYKRNYIDHEEVVEN